MYIHTHIYIYIYVHIYIYIYVTSRYMYISVHMYIHIYTHVYGYVSMLMYISLLQPGVWCYLGQVEEATGHHRFPVPDMIVRPELTNSGLLSRTLKLSYLNGDIVVNMVSPI